MSATDTAIRVIDWALRQVAGPPPRGDLLNVPALIRPAEELKTALRQLAVVTTARLRLSSPPDGEGYLGVGEAILATALGALHTPVLAQYLLQAVPAPNCTVQWITRHGLLEPALSFLTDNSLAEVRTACLLVSPLTALLADPPQQQHGDLVQFALELLDYPAGQRLLQLAMAEPALVRRVRLWRHELLERLRLAGDQGREFVLDVYEAMLIHYPEQALRQVHAARAVITDIQAAAEESRLREALAVAAWWESLWALQRSHPEALRARRYLGYQYREGLALYRLAQRLTGGAL